MNLDAFLRDAKGYSSVRFRAELIKRYFQTRYQEEEAPANIEPLPLMEQDLPLPPLAAARQVKGPLQVAARAQVRQAEKLMKEVATHAWLPRLNNVGQVLSFVVPSCT